MRRLASFLFLCSLGVFLGCQAIAGDVTLLAGATYTQTGSHVLAPGGDISVLAQNITIQEARETYQSETDTWFKQSGLTVSLSSPLISAVQTGSQMVQAAQNTSNTRMQALAAAGLAVQPQVQLVHGLAAGELVPVRVQKVWPALEHLHAKTPARMQPRQRRRHRGLALPRGRGGNQQSGAAGGGLCHGIPGRWCGHWGAHFRPTNSVRPGVA